MNTYFIGRTEVDLRRCSSRPRRDTVEESQAGSCRYPYIVGFWRMMGAGDSNGLSIWKWSQTCQCGDDGKRAALLCGARIGLSIKRVALRGCTANIQQRAKSTGGCLASP